MGITGLLPFLEKASKPTNISDYSGSTVAIDTYCWLHKGAFSCAEKLARGEQTDQYVFYCMKFINMLLSNKIKPILVFDGRHLPAKAETEKVRKKRRDVNRKKAAELLRADRVEEARNLIRRCVDVTHDMASALMARARSAGVDCIVAPYEADAQLAFFSISGIAHLIITEDSDLLLFGCKKVLFKMDIYGNGLLVDQGLLPLAMKQAADQFSLDKFRYMCILSGCDYLPSLPGIGLAKACKFIKRTADDDIYRALSRLGSYLNMNSLTVTQEYKDKFMIALAMFKYQPIYDPFRRQLAPLTPLPDGEKLPFDESLPSDTWLQLALGNLNPFTLKETNNWDPDNPKNFKTAGWSAGSKTNSIWSQDYQAPKQVMQKKLNAMFDNFVTRIEKPKCRTERKNFIEDTPSPKKNNLEDEFNNLRNMYNVTTSKEKSWLEEVKGINEEMSQIMDDILNGEDGIIELDDLFGGDSSLKKQGCSSSKSHSRNPFCKSSIINKTSQESPSEGALSRISKLSVSINETNGEVSRYFSNDYAEKEITPTKENIQQAGAADSSPPTADNILKDIINTPTKLASHEAILKSPESSTKTCRNIFSTIPNEKPNNDAEIFKNKTSPGSSSFLCMLDTMVSPTAEQNLQLKPKESIVRKLAPKKQGKLSFPDSLLSPSSDCCNIERDNADRENAEPMKVSGFVQALPTICGSKTKMNTSPSTFLTTPGRLVNHRLGPAKTVGLKRKKSTSDYSKQNQPSLFDMFAFQPKAKLKIQ